MNKRKINVQELKRSAVKNKKVREIGVKYESVLSYFKEKEPRDKEIFKVDFLPLIEDFLSDLSIAQLCFKLQNQCKEPIKQVVLTNNFLKFQSFNLKQISSQYPLQQICECLSVSGDNPRAIQISKNKLMIFFKKLRLIYSDFCYCAGEKIIVDANDVKTLYRLFKAVWSTNEEKGRMNQTEKVQKRICCSLYFIGILIENNIFAAIDTSERKKKDEQAELGTRSERKNNNKESAQPVSSTYSFGSLEIVSNMSVRLKSQKSNEEDFAAKKYQDYSEKSEKIISRTRHNLYEKAILGLLKFRISVQDEEPCLDFKRYQINYLSNDVENILIENAFKLQRFKAMDERDEHSNPSYAPHYNPTINNNFWYSNQFNNLHPYSPYSQFNSLSNEYCLVKQAQSPNDLQLLKRSLDCGNLLKNSKKKNSRHFGRV